MLNLASTAKTARTKQSRTTSENDSAALAYALVNASGQTVSLNAAGALDAPTIAAPTITTPTITSPTISGNTTSSGANIGSIQALSGVGAVNVTTTVTRLTTSGSAQALSLADGTAGQYKEIIHEVDGGSAVLTPTTKTGFSTITFTNVGDSCALRFLATRGWMIIALNGAVAA